MAFSTKYRYSFKDYYDRTIQIDLQYDPFVGTITELNGSGASMEWMGDDGDPLKVIRGVALTINLFESSTGQLDEFFTIKNNEVKVVLSVAGSVYWTGFILAGDYQRQDKYQPVPVTLTAVDGLGLLRGVQYDNNGELYTGREDAYTILQRCLQKTGLSLNVYEMVNVYEAGMTSTVASSSLKQTYIDNLAFVDEETLTPDCCYYVIEKILKLFSSIIFQERNGWVIIRLPEHHAPVNYRLINPSGTVIDSGETSTLNYKQLTANDAADSDYLRFINQDSLIKANPSKSVINLTRNYKYNLVLDPTFEFADLITDYWTKNGGGAGSISSDIDGSKVMKIESGSGIEWEYNESFTGTSIVGRFNIMGQMKLVPSSGSGPYNHHGFRVQIVAGGTTYYNDEDGEWITTGYQYTDTDDNSWRQIDIVTAPLPASTTSVKIMVLTQSTIIGGDIYFKNLQVQFISSGTTRDSITEQFEIEYDNLYGTDSDFVLDLTDSSQNFSEIFWRSALSLSSSDADTWQPRNSVVSDRLFNIAKDVYMATYIRPARVYQGTLKGQFNYLKSLYDGTYRYLPTRVRYDLEPCHWSGEWIQLTYPGFSEEQLESMTSALLPNDVTVTDNLDGTYRIYRNNSDLPGSDVTGIVNLNSLPEGYNYKFTFGVTNNSTGAVTFDLVWGTITESNVVDTDIFYIASQGVPAQLVFDIPAGTICDYTIDLSILKYYGY